MENTNVQMVDSPWKGFYRIAGISALVSELVIFLGLVTYFIWPYAPGHKTTAEIFLMLQSNLFGGLVSLDLFLVLGNVFSLFLYLALFLALKPVNPSYALAVLAVGLLGLVLIFPARPLLELFHLSQLYAGAASEADKAKYLAAGTALLALFDGIGWFLNTLLGGSSFLVSSFLMLRSNVFSKATAIVGIVSNVAVCGFFIPSLGLILLFLSLPGYMVWYFLLARTFFRLAK